MHKAHDAGMDAPIPSRQLLFMTQLSDSAFPSGGFAFSSGLETLVQEGRVADAKDYEQTIDRQILPRWFEFDRWFLQWAYRSVEGDKGLEALVRTDRRCDVQNLCDPLLQASVRMGRAALTTAEKIGIEGIGPYAAEQKCGRAPGHLPVVQGVIAANLGMSLQTAEVAAVHGLLSGALSAGVRMGRIGALAAQTALLRLGDVAAEGLQTPCPDLPHAFSPVAEIAAARRDRLSIRLFSA